jgi:protease-4
MRFILFVLKCVVGLLASIGFLIVAAAVALAIWADEVESLATAERQITDHSVLSLDMSAGLIEARSDNPFAQLSLGDTLTLREAVEALEAAGEDPRIEGLVARLGIGDLGIAQVQELRQAIGEFRETGKFAIAFAESFLETPFLRDALDKIGVVPRLDQREEYKGAMNTFTDRELPAPQRENLQQLLDSWLGQIVLDIAAARGSEDGAVRAVIDSGPHPASAALEQGLVDQLGYWDEVSDAIVTMAGEDAEFVPLAAYAKAHEPLPTPGPTVALIYGLGPVVLASGGDDGFFNDGGVMASDTVSEAIATAIDDPEIDAIVLRIDSPGGSYVASDVIWREVQLAKEADKPLIVSMSNVAASGGYFVAAPAHKIVALPGTVTGSIGVVSGKLIFKDLWDKLGITWDGVEAGTAAGYWSMNRDFTPEEWARLQATLDRIYRDFTGKVAEGRSLTPEAVAAAAKGQVWSGEDARDLGLVDELGGLKAALMLAAEAAGQPGERPQVIELPEPRDPFRAVMEDLFAGQVELARWRTVVRDLARLAAHFRPLMDGMEAMERGSEAPQLRSTNLSQQP